MNKYLLFISLALFASCSGWSRGNSIQVSPGITNTLNFACGSDNGSSASFQNGYSYGFYGIPSWLRSSGASLSGVPSGSGPWQFTVSFNGPNNAKGVWKLSWQPAKARPQVILEQQILCLHLGLSVEEYLIQPIGEILWYFSHIKAEALEVQVDQFSTGARIARQAR